jgi:hypothetical protein
MTVGVYIGARSDLKNYVAELRAGIDGGVWAMFRGGGAPADVQDVWTQFSTAEFETNSTTRSNRAKQ